LPNRLESPVCTNRGWLARHDDESRAPRHETAGGQPSSLRLLPSSLPSLLHVHGKVLSSFPFSLPRFRLVAQRSEASNNFTASELALCPRLFCFVLSAAAVHDHGSSRDNNLKIQSCSSQPPYLRLSVACAVSLVVVASTRFGWILVAASSRDRPHWVEDSSRLLSWTPLAIARYDLLRAFGVSCLLPSQFALIRSGCRSSTSDSFPFLGLAP
jgi:hypothetical protein